MLPKTVFENWVHPGHGIYFAFSIYIIISVFLWSVRHLHHSFSRKVRNSERRHLATDTDQLVLSTLFEQLNAIPGFPGIYPAEDGIQENVSIHFLEPTAFDDSFFEVMNGEYAFEAVQFWYYTEANELYTARVGYRTDIDQTTRNSVLPEEIINIPGITDTILRPDSITYQYSDENTTLSDVDLVILRLLYHPSIQCGMDADSCAAVIRELYD